MSRPLQVYMNDDDLVRLEAWARARGYTKSQAIRVAVRALTAKNEVDPLLTASGMIEGLPRDVSQRFDHYLENTFVAHKPASGSGKRKRARARVRR